MGFLLVTRFALGAGMELSLAWPGEHVRVMGPGNGPGQDVQTVESVRQWKKESIMAIFESFSQVLLMLGGMAASVLQMFVSALSGIL